MASMLPERINDQHFGTGDAAHRPALHPTASEVNALAWLLWLGAVAAVPLASRNPFYLGLALLVALVVYLSLPRRTSAARAWRLFVTVGSTLALLSVGFNVLTVHVGDRVFAELPESLPIAGGPLTYNALVYGILSALAIATMLVAAAAFNTAVRQGDLIRLMPASLAQTGIAGSIALTMVPATIAAARDIYDAQRARGLRIRGLRDAGGIVTPLLGASFERALALAEALESRGFGASTVAQPAAGWRRALTSAVTVLLLIAALVLLATGQLIAGVVALGCAGAAALRRATGRPPRTRFRPLGWNTASLSVAAAAVGAPLLIVTSAALTGATLAYDPFPRLATPPLDPLAGAAILLLLAPAIWTRP
jgi:energy-coupling factor transport system permease protein